MGDGICTGLKPHSSLDNLENRTCHICGLHITCAYTPIGWISSLSACQVKSDLHDNFLKGTSGRVFYREFIITWVGLGSIHWN